MARLLKYRFDLLDPGESLLCEGATEADVDRRVTDYVIRRLANPKTKGLPLRAYSIRAVDGGVEVERTQ